MIKRRKYPEQVADLFSRRDLLKRAVELSKKRGIKFGIVEHPGRGYRIVNDEAIGQVSLNIAFRWQSRAA